MATSATTTGTPKKDSLKWKEVTIGGISGILLGGAGSFAATAATLGNTEEVVEENSEENAENAAEENATVEEGAHVVAHGNVASGVNDNMSFNEAFAAARSEVGAGGCFVWHGNVYGTYYANEWNAMSPAQREDFTAQSLGVDTSHSHATYSHHSTSTNAQSVDNHSEQHVAQENETTLEDEMTVEILGVEQVQHEDGSVSNIGAASISGQAVYFIDVDGEDGEFELMAADLNANGSLEENEITDISDQHMQVSEFQELAQVSGYDGGAGNEVEEYYASNENLPDYVNDADPIDLA